MEIEREDIQGRGEKGSVLEGGAARESEGEALRGAALGEVVHHAHRILALLRCLHTSCQHMQACKGREEVREGSAESECYAE